MFHTICILIFKILNPPMPPYVYIKLLKHNAAEDYFSANNSKNEYMHAHVYVCTHMCTNVHICMSVSVLMWEAVMGSWRAQLFRYY